MTMSTLWHIPALLLALLLIPGPNQVEAGNKWTIPVSSDDISAARRGDWDIVLTPTKPVPHQWFSVLTDLDVLCLASGGGQQGPILAAAGANVTAM